MENDNLKKNERPYQLKSTSECNIIMPIRNKLEVFWIGTALSLENTIACDKAHLKEKLKCYQTEIATTT